MAVGVARRDICCVSAVHIIGDVHGIAPDRTVGRVAVAV